MKKLINLDNGWLPENTGFRMLRSTVAKSNEYNSEGSRSQRVRLLNINTGEYLHLSTQSDTDDVNWSWLGTRQQANVLESRGVISWEKYIKVGP